MILLTLDTSAASEGALNEGIELARRFDLPLHLLVVIDGPLRHLFTEQSREQDLPVDTLVERYFEGVLARIPRDEVTVTTEFRHSADAATGIIAAAGEAEVSLVVMATHGRTGLRRFLTGSVTADVVRESPVPVVVVPTRTTEDE